MKSTFIEWQALNPPPWRTFDASELSLVHNLDSELVNLLERFGLPLFASPYFSFCDFEYASTEDYLLIGSGTFEEKIGLHKRSGEVFAIVDTNPNQVYVAKSLAVLINILFQFAKMVEVAVLENERSFVDNKISPDLVADFRERVEAIDHKAIKPDGYWGMIVAGLLRQASDFWEHEKRVDS